MRRRVAFEALGVPEAIHFVEHGVKDDDIRRQVAVFNAESPKVDEQREGGAGGVDIPGPEF